jgi:uncharacterized DUF497 family protein
MRKSSVYDTNWGAARDSNYFKNEKDNDILSIFLDICILYVYTRKMDIVWDPEKARTNMKRHGIRFSDAEMVFFDPNALTREDLDVNNEQRFVSIGMDAIGRVLVVVYTYRGEDIRLISARSATKREREKYEEGI